MKDINFHIHFVNILIAHLMWGGGNREQRCKNHRSRRFSVKAGVRDCCPRAPPAVSNGVWSLHSIVPLLSSFSPPFKLNSSLCRLRLASPRPIPSPVTKLHQSFVQDSFPICLYVPSILPITTKEDYPKRLCLGLRLSVTILHKSPTRPIGEQSPIPVGFMRTTTYQAEGSSDVSTDAEKGVELDFVTMAIQ
jgi:hypothetical protein